jgi:hypothetical protein
MCIAGITRTWIAAATGAVIPFAFALLISGCQTKYERNAAITAALNNYYGTHQDCLFADAIKFPERADAENQAETNELDALVDAGLLQRTGADNTGHARRRGHGAEYQLSNIGRQDWTTDSERQGYGNFCFGHPQVSAIDRSTEVHGGSLMRYYVSYRDQVVLPLWATMPEVERAFPSVVKDSSGQTATATMVKNSNGWKVQNVSPPVANPLG